MSAAAIARCIREQADCLNSGKPLDHHLVQLGIHDWLTEEALIRLEVENERTSMAEGPHPLILAAAL